MSDVAKLVGDLTRLSAEIESSKGQVAKLKAKAADGLGSKEKVRWAAAQVAESQALYDAVYAELPADVAAGVKEHIARITEAQAALDALNAELNAAYPPPVDVTVAEATGSAHDATVQVS